MTFKNWMENQVGIQMWHGSRRWDGLPEIRAPKKGRYEAGVGIYLTSSYERARQYSKGGGSTLLITLKPEIRYAKDVQIALPIIDGFFETMPQSKKLKMIRQDVINNAQRMNSNSIHAEVLLNLFINYEAGSGNSGLKLAEFLKQQGVDANLHHSSGNEYWIVVINPNIIANVEKISAKDVQLNTFNLQNKYQ